jgi:hypothetical protein
MDVRSISLFEVILGTLFSELTYCLAKLKFESLCRPALTSLAAKLRFSIMQPEAV